MPGINPAALAKMFQGQQNPLYPNQPAPDPSQPTPSPTSAPPASTAPQSPSPAPAPQASAPTPAPQPGQISASLSPSPQPSAAPPSGADKLFNQSSAAPSLDDWTAQHGHAPIEAPPPAVPQHGTLYKIFEGLGRAVGSPIAEQNAERDWNLKQQGIAYQRNAPVMQHTADQGAFKEAQDISHTQAQTHLENVQADVAQQNLPLQEATQKHYQQLMQTWQNKDVPDFDSYAQTYLQGLPPVMARMLAPHLAAIKQMPQTGKGYKINMQDDLPTSINVYGKDYSRNDPQLAKLPGGAEAIADFDRAQAAHNTKRGEKFTDESNAAAFGAQKMAQSFSNQQTMEATKKVQPAIDTALTADQRLARMEKSYTKGVAGDQQAQLALLADHLGMTFGMQKGAKLNRGLIEEAQQSQPWLAKIGAKFDDKGYLSGVALGPEQMKQMLDLGYDARDQAWKGAHDASTAYQVPLPPGATKVEQQRQPGAKPLLQQGGTQGDDVIYARDAKGVLHKAAKGTELPKGWKAENAPAAK